MEIPQELALQGRLLSSVLGFLPPPSLCISVLVCRIWHAAATDDTWRRTAEQAWPAKSVRLVSRDQLAVEAGIALQYSTFRQLVLGQNKYNVGLSRRRGLPALLNRWRHNTATRCYLNHILAVHYCPIDEGGALRVYYEARGESDLRNPLTSAVSLRLETAQDHVSGPSGKVNHAVIGSALPDVERSRFFVEKRGHYKGVLVRTTRARAQCADAHECAHARGHTSAQKIACDCSQAQVSAFGPREQQCGARLMLVLVCMACCILCATRCTLHVSRGTLHVSCCMVHGACCTLDRCTRLVRSSSSAARGRMSHSTSRLHVTLVTASTW